MLNPGSIKNPAKQGEQDFVSGGYAAYVVGLLSVLYLFGSLDRQIITILAEPIKQELHLLDWQLGAISGLAFSLFYTTLGIPIAKLSDRFNRAKIISVCLLLWSFFTALSSLSQNFIHLLLLRVAVGVGEAGVSPASHSLISDYVSREKRALALSIYALGFPLGILFALAIGGIVAQGWGWRWALFWAGAPGILLASVTYFSLKERRLEPAISLPTVVAPPTTLGVLRELRSQPSFWYVAGGCAGIAFVTTAFQSFAAPFFLRNHAGEVSELARISGAFLGVHLSALGFLGIALGIAAGATGAIGILVGGISANILGRANAQNILLAPIMAAVLSGPLLFLACIVEDTVIALSAWAGGMLFIMVPTGPAFAVVQSVAPPQSRGMTAAILLFIMNLVGAGLGPLVAGGLSDVFSAAGFEGGAGVRYSLAGITTVSLLAALLFWKAKRNFQNR